MKLFRKEAFLFAFLCCLSGLFVLTGYYLLFRKEVLREDDESKGGFGLNNDKENQVALTCPGIGFVQDGVCDDSYNTPQCGFDGKDCCNADSDYSTCIDCKCKDPAPVYESI